jgi:hypothetical protein
VFITDFRSSFRNAMNGRNFRGQLEIIDIADWDGNDLRDALIMLRTRARYWDEQGGESHGEIAAAITNPPEN